jgi:hypothetical protein
MIKKHFKLDNVFKALSLCSFGLDINKLVYREKIKSVRVKLELEELRRMKLEDEKIELLHKWKDSLQDCNEFMRKFMELSKKGENLNNEITKVDNTNLKTDKIVGNDGTLNSNQQTVLDNIDSKEIVECSSNILEEFHNYNNNLEKLIDLRRKSMDSLQPNDFINNFDFNFFNTLDSIREYISSLNYEQLVAFINLTGIITIALCIYSIIIIFYSEKLIIYCKLEERWPKLVKFIQLRRKFQNYYFIIDILIIFFILIGMGYVNILVLFNS